jgi:hypothetical protein
MLNTYVALRTNAFLEKSGNSQADGCNAFMFYTQMISGAVNQNNVRILELLANGLEGEAKSAFFYNVDRWIRDVFAAGHGHRSVYFEITRDASRHPQEYGHGE